ncbi:CHAT domain-containing protein [Streptomyces sp. NBC_00047]|uniref:CHAT domain-containing protein n=1 Tax=Streptomyces sp. NBC_00047 TaxID=2975627 RepID=UPI00225B9D07|nr:CHAT domain-containing protein [Streptomyces sp. NBC_00047]MCX5609861.1 CHAT domain-containing protein [Streptomyces sp. NBC_00047]
MFGWALLKLWGSLRADTFTWPEPRDPVAAGERIRRLGALPAEELLRTIDGEGGPRHEPLSADLVALAAGAGVGWHDAETAGAMAEVLAAVGMGLAASGEGRDALETGDRIQIEAHVLRGIAADRARDSEEAHRQFARADHRGSAAGHPIAVALGRIGMLATAESIPAADDLQGAVDRALEPLEGLAPGPALEEVRRATRARVSAREAASRWWASAGRASARRRLERWLYQHRDGGPEELVRALLPGLARSVAEEDGRVADRARVLDEAFAAHPRFALFRGALGRLYYDVGRPALAVEVLEPLYAARPGDRSTAVRLALAYDSAGRGEQAVPVLRAHLSEPPLPEDEAVLTVLVGILRDLGSPEYAVWDAHLARIRGDAGMIEMLPTAVRSRLAQQPAPARLLARFEDGTLTIDPGAASLSRSQMQAHLLAALYGGSPNGGEMLAGLAERDPAMGAEVAGLLGVAPDAPDAPAAAADRADVDEILRRGDEHFQRRELTQAEACYRQARELDPDSAMALLWLGDVHYARQEKSVARVYFEESLATEETPMAWRFLGDTLAAEPTTVERARACYQRALAMDPGYGGARQGLARLPPAPEPAPAPAALAVPLPEPAPVLEPAPPPGPAPAPGPAQAPVAAEPIPGPARAPEPVPEPVARPARPRRNAAPPPEEPQRDPAFERLSASGVLAHVPEKLEAVMREKDPSIPELLDSLEDDEAFARWQEWWLPEHFGYVYTGLWSLAWQWSAKAGNTRRALLMAQRQAQIAESLKSQWGGDTAEGAGKALLVTTALEHVASILGDLGRYDEAYAVLRRAETWLETDRVERERVGRPLEGMLGGYMEEGNPRVELYQRLAGAAERCGAQEAAAGHRRQADEWREEGPRSDQERILRMIYESVVSLREGDADRAFRFLDLALPLAQREAAWSTVKQILAFVHHSRAKALSELGLERTALQHLAEARACNAGNADRLSADWRVTAGILGKRPALGDPLEAYEHVLHLSGVPGRDGDPLLWRPRRVPGEPVRIEHPERAWAVIGPMARAAWDTGEPETAAAVLELGVDLADLVRAQQTDPALRRRIQDERADVYELLTRYRVDGYGSTEAAFTVSERLRARSLLDAMSTAELRAPTGVPGELLAREAALLRERTAVEQAPHTDWALHHDIGRKLAAVWTAIAERCPAAEEYVAIRRATVTAPGAVLEELAGERVVVASYAQLGDGRTVLFTLDPRHGLAVTGIDADGERMLRFIADNLGSAGRVREMAIDMPGLFQQVLGPLVAPLKGLTAPGDTVLICPTGALHNVPFHALSPDGGATLLDRNPVGYLPSVSLLRTLGHRTAGNGRGAVVLGDPGGDLPHARSEARLLGARLGTDPLIGEAATRERVLRDMAGAEILHAACHASFQDDDPLASGLLLADGVLTGHDILRQNWHGVRLAVLSACETGLGRTGRTDETLGLSRALLFAGVRSLIMSLWRVPDAATASIMGDFHDLTLSGERPDQALRTAMLAARDRPGGDRLDRWAAFCLLGEWRAPHPTGKGAPHAGHR